MTWIRRSKKYLGIKTIKFEDIAGKGAKQITFNQVDVGRAAEYSAEDADVTLQLHLALWPQIEALPRLKTLYETIEQPLVPVLYRMERTGVLVDRERLRTQSSELAARMLELQALAHIEAGGPFNVDSPKQLQEILFGKLGIPVIRKTPTGQPSTAEDVLEELAASYSLPKLILEYRGVAKLKSTYTDKLPQQNRSAYGPHSYVLPSGGRRDRQALFFGSESAKYSDPHAGGAAHSPGFRGAAGPFAGSRRLFAN